MLRFYFCLRRYEIDIVLCVFHWSWVPLNVKISTDCIYIAKEFVERKRIIDFEYSFLRRNVSGRNTWKGILILWCAKLLEAIIFPVVYVQQQTYVFCFIDKCKILMHFLKNSEVPITVDNTCLKQKYLGYWILFSTVLKRRRKLLSFFFFFLFSSLLYIVHFISPAYRPWFTKLQSYKILINLQFCFFIFC